MKHIRFVPIALALLLSGCASVQTNPTNTQLQSARQLAREALVATRTGLGITQEVGRLASTLPLTSAQKDAVDCAIARVTGTSTPATEAVVKVCGPIPLAAAAPLAIAVKALASVTSCASLSTTLGEVLKAVEPLIARLEAAGNASLTFAAISIRSAFAFMNGMGGATCS